MSVDKFRSIVRMHFIPKEWVSFSSQIKAFLCSLLSLSEYRFTLKPTKCDVGSTQRINECSGSGAPTMLDKVNLYRSRCTSILFTKYFYRYFLIEKRMYLFVVLSFLVTTQPVDNSVSLDEEVSIQCSACQFTNLTISNNFLKRS
jgi:hypothetical protein